MRGLEDGYKISRSGVVVDLYEMSLRLQYCSRKIRFVHTDEAAVVVKPRCSVVVSMEWFDASVP